MIPCKDFCEREQISQDAYSPGPISDAEVIARGAYEPSHGTASTLNIKKGLFSWKELLDGRSSVWRVSETGIDLTELAERLEQKPGLFAIVGVPANDIRAIQYHGRRLFCVVDECDTDFNGGKHAAHGHIAICRNQIPEVDEDRQVIGQQACMFLLQIYRDRKVWTKPPAS